MLTDKCQNHQPTIKNMKHTILFLVLTLLIACKQTTETKKETTTEKTTEKVVRTYPESISKVFKAHGGLDAWQKMKTLEFEIGNPKGKEKTTLDLKSRKSLIAAESEAGTYQLGFDGERIWLQDSSKIYKGNAKFYYNLMYYFCAMPFILADDGINYKDVEPLELDGKTYPGIKISYNAGVGESPEDEYILYYDSETNQMAWLAYTVTYFTKEKADKFNFIKYGDWNNVNGLTMPKTITWFNTENNLPTTKRNDLSFENATLSVEAPKEDFFKKPETVEFID